MARSGSASKGSFVPTGSMTTARSLHTATLLGDGRVLIAGGADATGVTLASAEVYDPLTGLFNVTGSMLDHRLGAEAALLRNGKVLVVGGQDSNGQAIGSVELYDPITGLFAQTGELLTPRYNPTVTLLKGGRVLVAGGYGGAGESAPLASAEIYQPKKGLFKETGSMSTPRRNATATRLDDGSVLVAGGYNGDAVNSPELFNPRSGTFVPAAEMSSARRYATASLLPNGTVLIAGGFGAASGNVLNSSDRFLPGRSSSIKSGGRFVADDSMATARGRHAAASVGRNTILITGGYDGVKPLDSAERYSISGQRFKKTGAMTTARWRHTATSLEDGTILVAGGADANGAVASAELYFLSGDARFSQNSLQEPAFGLWQI